MQPNKDLSLKAADSNNKKSVALDPMFKNMHESVLDAAQDCILLVDLNGKILLLNKAARISGGMGPGDIGDVSWFEVVPPEDLKTSQEQFAKAVAGEIARFPLTTYVNGETRHWDIVFNPVRDDDNQVSYILSVGRDVTSAHALEEALAEAAAREKLITQEMQHRIKNLFSVVSVLISMAERETKSEGTPEKLAPLLKAKINALARASEASYTSEDMPTDSSIEVGAKSVDLFKLVKAVLEPYSSLVTIEEQKNTICRKSVTTLTLFLHEMATNAAKYGALSVSSGHVHVSWQQSESGLCLTWTETNGPKIDAEPDHMGFGSAMPDRLVSLAGGSIERNWQHEGLFARLILKH